MFLASEHTKAGVVVLDDLSTYVTLYVTPDVTPDVNRTAQPVR
ncbi:hypothetical protein ACFC09_04800 [Streptomyces sp. NPDC056161]